MNQKDYKEKKIGDAMLSVSDSVFSVIDKNMTDVMWVYNLHSQKYEYISPSIYLLRGITADQAMAENFHESLHPTDFEYIATNLRPRIERFETGDDAMRTITGEFRQPHANGEMIWVEISSVLIKNEQGRVDRLMGISRNIQHKKIEFQQLANTQSLFETVFNFTGTGIAIIRENGSFINVNSGFCNMLNYPKSYIMNKSFFDLVVKGDESCVAEVFESTRQEKNFDKQTEVRFVNLYGQIVWGLMNITGVKSAKSKKFNWVIQIQETTSRKKAEETIRHLNADLHQKNLEMEQLVYVTSHDLRSPLVNIKGFSGELMFSIQSLLNLFKEKLTANELTRIGEVETEIGEAFDYIETSVNKMDKLLTGLLAYSRLGKKPAPKTHINMNELVSNVLKTSEFQIKSKSIEITRSELPQCYGNEDLINQAFSNILSNAIKYLDPKRSGKIKITGQMHTHYSVYFIEDNGIGIDERQQDKIFELFYRVNSEKNDGEGLGLSNAKKIMELSGGRIELKSMLNEGSIFKLYLPQNGKADIG